MSRSKPATRKRARRPKVVVRAQRKKQASVRSPNASHLRIVRSTESPSEVHDGSKEDFPMENRHRAAALEAMLQSAVQEKKGFDFSQVIANVQAYQAKFLEVTQGNMQFFFDFSQRLATTKSPFEFLAVVVEFAGKRFIMVLEHSNELGSFWRVGSFRELPLRQPLAAA